MRFLTRLLLTSIIFSMLSFTVLAMPQAGDFTKSGKQNESVTFTKEDFINNYTDVANPSVGISKIRIGTSIPSDQTGTLMLEQSVISVGQEILINEINKMFFMPKTDFVGETSFNYKAVNDNGEESNLADVSIMITSNLTTAVPTSGPTEAPSAAPTEAPAATPTVMPSATPMPLVALDGVLNALKNTPANGIMQYSGGEGLQVEYQIINTPTKGEVNNIQANGSFTYIPHLDKLGTDSFTFVVKSGGITSNQATMSINIQEPISEPSFIYEDMLGHWGEFSAINLADKGSILGERINNKYYFNPNVKMTRGDFILFLNSVIDINESKIYDSTNPFSDSYIPSWYYAESKAMFDRGIVNGVLENGKVYLMPEQPLTRIEALGMIHNAINPTAMNTEDITFADKDSIPLWANQIVKNMKGYGLLKGYDDNTIRPFATVTRAQAAEMIWQMEKYKKTYKTVSIDKTLDADTAKTLRVSNMYMMGIPYEGMEVAKILDDIAMIEKKIE